MKRIKRILSVVLAVVMIAGILPIYDGVFGDSLFVPEARADSAEDDALVDEWVQSLRDNVSDYAVEILLDGIIRAMVKYQKLLVEEYSAEFLGIDGSQFPIYATGINPFAVCTLYADGVLPEGADTDYTPTKMTDIVSLLGLDAETVLDNLSSFTQGAGYGNILDADLDYTGILRDWREVWDGSLWDYFLYIVTALYQSNRGLYDNILFDGALYAENMQVYGLAEDVDITVSYAGLSYTLTYDMGIALTGFDIRFIPIDLYRYSLRPFFIALLKALYPEMTIEDFRINNWIPVRLRRYRDDMNAYDVMSALFTPIRIICDAISENPADALGKVLPTLSYHLNELKTNGFYRRGSGFGHCSGGISAGGAVIDESATRSTATGSVNNAVQNAVMKLALIKMRDYVSSPQGFDHYLVEDPAELALDDVVAAEILNRPCSAGTPFFDTGKDLILPVLYDGEDALRFKGQLVAVPEGEEYPQLDDESVDTAYDGYVYYVEPDAAAVNGYLHTLSEELKNLGGIGIVNGFQELIGAHTFAYKVEDGLHLPEAACAYMTVSGAGDPCEDLTATITCSQDGCGDTVAECLRIGHHDFGEWTVIPPATCLQDHEERRVCRNCGYDETKTVIAGKHHGFELKTIKVFFDDYGEPFCVTYEYYCPRCAETIAVRSESENVNCEHDTEWLCESVADGWHIWKCSACGEMVSWGQCSYCFESDDPELNTVTGVCDVCGAEKTVEVRDVCEHELTSVSDEDYLCGRHIRQCMVCGEMWYEACKDTEIITDCEVTNEELLAEINAGICSICGRPVRHLYGEWTVIQPATCDEDGEEQHVCYSCEHVETRPISATGHAFGEWTVIQPATCDEDGVEQRVCANNGEHVETRPISATGHAYGEWTVVTPATCEQDGVEQRVCANNGEHVETRPVSATGHAYGEWTVVTPATCEQDGVERRVCANNGEHVETRPIKANGHAYGEWTVVVPATCDEDGVEQRVCANDPGHVETRPVEATGHVFGEWTVTKAATYLHEGVRARSCSRCPERETEILPKLVPDETKTDETTGSQLSYQEDVVPANTKIVVDEEFDGEGFLILNREKGDLPKELYNITLESNGEKIQPNGYVLVRLPIPEGYDPAYIAVYYIDVSGMHKLESYIDGNYVCFETTHFSEYAIVDESPAPEGPAEPESNCVCGKYHTGLFAAVTIFFHKIIYFFRNLFK
ncbi:MAG: hypothetical protein K6G71_06235 [Clostridiales bacterium]|nr:hypothetical protein [Clostridiales bacterium]